MKDVLKFFLVIAVFWLGCRIGQLTMPSEELFEATVNRACSEGPGGMLINTTHKGATMTIKCPYNPNFRIAGSM